MKKLIVSLGKEIFTMYVMDLAADPEVKKKVREEAGKAIKSVKKGAIKAGGKCKTVSGKAKDTIKRIAA